MPRKNSPDLKNWKIFILIRRHKHSSTRQHQCWKVIYLRCSHSGGSIHRLYVYLSCGCERNLQKWNWNRTYSQGIVNFICAGVANFFLFDVRWNFSVWYLDKFEAFWNKFYCYLNYWCRGYYYLYFFCNKWQKSYINIIEWVGCLN